MRAKRNLSPAGIKNRLYTDEVDRWVRRLGIKPLVGSVYKGTKRAYERVMMATNDTYTLEVGDASAEFHMPTVAEFRDLNQLKEQPVIEDLIARLHPDDVFYDIGANIGMYSCLAADVASHVIAFEPHPPTADRLEQNAALNSGPITVYRCALSDTEGTAEFALGLNIIGSTGHTLRSEIRPDARTINVETATGDQFIADEQLPSPTVMKIDVEGAELQTLRGLQSTIDRPECRLLYCEVHGEDANSKERALNEVRDLLHDAGFSTSEPLPVLEEPYMPIIRAERNHSGH
jgi:FkbM family methyltransferase